MFLNTNLASIAGFSMQMKLSEATRTLMNRARKRCRTKGSDYFAKSSQLAFMSYPPLMIPAEYKIMSKWNRYSEYEMTATGNQQLADRKERI